MYTVEAFGYSEALVPKFLAVVDTCHRRDGRDATNHHLYAKVSLNVWVVLSQHRGPSQGITENREHARQPYV